MLVLVPQGLQYMPHQLQVGGTASPFTVRAGPGIGCMLKMTDHVPAGLHRQRVLLWMSKHACLLLEWLWRLCTAAATLCTITAGGAADDLIYQLCPRDARALKVRMGMLSRGLLQPGACQHLKP